MQGKDQDLIYLLQITDPVVCQSIPNLQFNHRISIVSLAKFFMDANKLLLHAGFRFPLSVIIAGQPELEYITVP